jgi:Uma2 family endonuclease
MASIAFETREAIDSAPEPCVVLRDVDWAGYESLLDIRGERSTPRIVYLDGSLFLVSPSFPHEHLKVRLGWFVSVIVEELDLPCGPSGSTTFRRKSKKGGVEGDQSYYLANEAAIRGKASIDLDVDPPPDLAVEVAWTRKADAAVEVYRRLGVPEIWICDGLNLEVLILDDSKQYVLADRSDALPVLASEIREWVLAPPEGGETAWMKRLRRWVREAVAPRSRGPNPD